MVRLTALFALLIATTQTVYAQRITFIEIENLNDWEKVLTLARAQDKPLFVFTNDFYCQPCHILQRETFRHRQLRKFVRENFIPVQVNGYQAFAKPFFKTYGVIGPGELLVLTNREILLTRYLPPEHPDSLLADFPRVVELAQKYPQWARSAASGNLDKESWATFLLIEHANNLVTPESPIVRDIQVWLDSADIQNEKFFEFFYNLAVDSDFRIFQLLSPETNPLAGDSRFTRDIYFQNAYNHNINKAIVNADSILLEDKIAQLKNFWMPEPKAQNFELRARQMFLAELGKWQAYDTITHTFLQSMPADSANVYQREALFLLENYASNETYNIILKYIKGGLKHGETYELYYTLSLLLLKTNDILNAYKSANAAYGLARDNEQRRVAASLIMFIEREYY